MKEQNSIDKRVRSGAAKLVVGAGASGAIGLGMTLMGAGAAHAADIVSDAVAGLKEYQIFKTSGTNLSDGAISAKNLMETEIGITVISEKNIQGKNPLDVAKQINAKTSTQYDTTIVIVDGKKDSFHVYSSKPEVQKALQSTVGNVEVDDAGWELLNNNDAILDSYVNAGGNASSSLKSQVASRTEKVTEANTSDSFVTKSIEGIKSYQVFLNDGAKLSEGANVADGINGAKISIVVVPESQMKGKDANVVSNLIKDGKNNYDTVILVTDGAKDSISIATDVPAFKEKFEKIVKTNVPVDDAGWELLNNRNDFLKSYSDSGGQVSNTLAESLAHSSVSESIVMSSAQGLHEYQIFSQPGAKLAESGALVTKISNKNMGIVVVTEESVQGKDTSVLSDSILDNADDVYDTVILVTDGAKDTINVSSQVPNFKSEFETIVTQKVDDAGWELLAKSDAFVGKYDQLIAEVQANEKSIANENFNNSVDALGTVGGFVIGGFAAITAIIYGGRKLHNRYVAKRDARIEEEATFEYKVKNYFKDSSDEFRGAIVALMNVSELQKDKIVNEENILSSEIEKICTSLEDLFEALNRKGVMNKLSIEIEYTDRLKKLVYLLGDDYYIYISNKPKQWRSSANRLKKVREAVLALDSQIMQNIQQVNDDREIDFQVALRALLDINDSDYNDVFEKTENTVVSSGKSSEKPKWWSMKD